MTSARKSPTSRSRPASSAKVCIHSFHSNDDAHCAGRRIPRADAPTSVMPNARPPQREVVSESWHWNREGLVPSHQGRDMALDPHPMGATWHCPPSLALEQGGRIHRKIWHQNREGLVPLPYLALEQGGLVPHPSHDRDAVLHCRTLFRE
jgi:hypothetical protein